MSPGRAADILRAIVAAKGEAEGVNGQDAFEALAAAPVGTTCGVQGTPNTGRYRAVKLADGWGRRSANHVHHNGREDTGSVVGRVVAQQLAGHTDIALRQHTPVGWVLWSTIQLPADAPTAEPEVLLRRFCEAMHLHHISDAVILSFLAAHAR